MLNIKEQDMRKVVTEILKKAGSEEQEAGLVAKHLVRSNLYGHDSHGVGMVPTYVSNIGRGLLKPNTPAKLIKDDGAILVFDGQRGFGQRVANEAMTRPMREISVARGYDIKDHVLACFGGAGSQHACAIARELGISRIYQPPSSESPPPLRE